MKRKLVAAIALLFGFIHPAYAEGRFATADGIINSLGSVFTLVAGVENMERNGFLHFRGAYSDAETGAGDLEIEISEDVTLEQAIAFARERGIFLSQSFDRRFELPGATWNKTVYLASGEISGSIISTDDPLPVIPILVAGSVIMLTIYAVDVITCEGDLRPRVKIFSSDGLISYESECVSSDENS